MDLYQYQLIDEMKKCSSIKNWGNNVKYLNY